MGINRKMKTIGSLSIVALLIYYFLFLSPLGSSNVTKIEVLERDGSGEIVAVNVISNLDDNILRIIKGSFSIRTRITKSAWDASYIIYTDNGLQLYLCEEEGRFVIHCEKYKRIKCGEWRIVLNEEKAIVALEYLRMTAEGVKEYVAEKGVGNIVFDDFSKLPHKCLNYSDAINVEYALVDGNKLLLCGSNDEVPFSIILVYKDGEREYLKGSAN